MVDDGGPIVGEDLALVLKTLAMRDPTPILEAARENPELLQYLPGVGPVVEVTREELEKLYPSKAKLDAE